MTSDCQKYFLQEIIKPSPSRIRDTWARLWNWSEEVSGLRFIFHLLQILQRVWVSGIRGSPPLRILLCLDSLLFYSLLYSTPTILLQLLSPPLTTFITSFMLFQWNSVTHLLWILNELPSMPLLGTLFILYSFFFIIFFNLYILIIKMNLKPLSMWVLSIIFS